MSILHFIRAGATGSCGTVVEPLNDWRKFPIARLHVSYARGFTLGEAMWQSVATPHQVIFVGDPLARPFAIKSPEVSVQKMEGGGRRVRADAGEWGHGLGGILLSIDGAPATRVPAEAATDTRIVLRFAKRGPPGETGKRRTLQVIAGAHLPAGRSPAVAFESIATRVNAFADFPVSARAVGDALELSYTVDTGVAPAFQVLCRNPKGGVTTWVPNESLCRFKGQSGALPARASFHVRGRAKRDTRLAIVIDDIEHHVQIARGQLSHQVLQTMIDTFAGDERITGPDGLELSVVKGKSTWARLLVRSRKPGPEWNGRIVKLRIGRSEGFQFSPYERQAKLAGGTAQKPGAYVLRLLPNQVPPGRTIRLSVGDRTLALAGGAERDGPRRRAAFGLTRAHGKTTVQVYAASSVADGRRESAQRGDVSVCRVVSLGGL